MLQKVLNAKLPLSHFGNQNGMMGVANAIVASWGRSTRRGRQIATIQEASSIQIHASIRAGLFHMFLAKSGFNRIWTTPKNGQGRLCDDYWVVWFDGDLRRAVFRGIPSLVRFRCFCHQASVVQSPLTLVQISRLVSCLVLCLISITTPFLGWMVRGWSNQSGSLTFPFSLLCFVFGSLDSADL